MVKYSFSKKVVCFLIPLVGILGCDFVSGKDGEKNLSADLVSLVVLSNSASATAPPSNLNYEGTPFVFFRNAAISTKVPTVTGKIESCKSNLTLPTGINLGNTCTLSGTPTVNQALTNYSITGANSIGSTSTTISIQVKDAVCGNGVIEGNEVCDDNNTANGDSCKSDCSGA